MRVNSRCPDTQAWQLLLLSQLGRSKDLQNYLLVRLAAHNVRDGMTTFWQGYVLKATPIYKWLHYIKDDLAEHTSIGERIQETVADYYLFAGRNRLRPKSALLEDATVTYLNGHLICGGQKEEIKEEQKQQLAKLLKTQGVAKADSESRAIEAIFHARGQEAGDSEWSHSQSGAERAQRNG